MSDLCTADPYFKRKKFAFHTCALNNDTVTDKNNDDDLNNNNNKMSLI